MARKRRRRLPDDLDGIEDIDKLAWWARQSINVIGGTLLIFFTWLQLREVPLADVVRNTTPEILLRAVLVVYYASWIGGATFDTKIQQRVYVADPKRGNVKFDTIIVIGSFFVVAILLIWASSNERIFVFVLLVFVGANFLGWKHIVGRVNPIIDASESRFREREDFFRVEQLRIVSDYMCGNWQTHRFIAMGAVLLIANIITPLDDLKIAIGRFVSATSGIPPTAIAGLLPGICVLVFVLVAEMWIWFKRVNVGSALIVIDDLRERYVLKEQ